MLPVTGSPGEVHVWKVTRLNAETGAVPMAGVVR